MRYLLLFLSLLGFGVMSASAATPTVTLLANNAHTITIPFQTSARLTWTSSNAVSCTASDGVGTWTGTLATSGSFTTTNLSDQAIFTITCKNSSNVTVSDTVTINVQPDKGQASITFTADQNEGSTTIDYGASTTLAWTSDTTIFCSSIYTGGKADLGKPLNQKIEGSVVKNNLTTTQTFFINCESPSGSVSTSSVIVNVNPQPLPDITFTADQNDDTSTIGYGSSTKLAWSTQNTSTSSCVLISVDTLVGTTSKNIVSVPPQGTKISSSLFGPMTFTLTCKNTSGVASSSVDVTVDAPTNATSSPQITTPAAVGPTCLSLQSAIHYGSRDDATYSVTALQTFLAAQGFYTNKPTGFAGEGTVRAIQAFQKKMKIKQTGYVGALTRAKIEALSCH